MAALLTFVAADIRIEGIAVDTPLPASWLGAKLSNTEVLAPEQDGRIRGRLSRSGTSDIVVRTRVTACLGVPCVRCLEPALVDVNADLSLLLLPAPRSKERGARDRKNDEEHEFSADEATEDVYDGETVVLDPFVRELLLLEVPSFPLCRDDCPGLPIDADDTPPQAADPRLAPWSAFREEGRAPDEPVSLDDLVAAARQRSQELRGLGKRAVLRSSHAGHAAPQKGKRKK
jgi:uncharacterized protein